MFTDEATARVRESHPDNLANKFATHPGVTKARPLDFLLEGPTKQAGDTHLPEALRPQAALITKLAGAKAAGEELDISGATARSFAQGKVGQREDEALVKLNESAAAGIREKVLDITSNFLDSLKVDDFEDLGLHEQLSALKVTADVSQKLAPRNKISGEGQKQAIFINVKEKEAEDYPEVRVKAENE